MSETDQKIIFSSRARTYHLCKNCPGVRAIPKIYKVIATRADAGNRALCGTCKAMRDAKQPTECNCV